MYEQTQKAAQEQAKADKEKTEAEAEAVKDKAKARDDLLKILYATDEYGDSVNSDEYKKQAAYSFYDQYGTDPIIDSYMTSMGWEIPITTTDEEANESQEQTNSGKTQRTSDFLDKNSKFYSGELTEAQRTTLLKKLENLYNGGGLNEEELYYLLVTYGLKE
jgi:hypothetical protein